MQRGVRTLLFVDDDESIRAGAVKALGSLGCTIVAAGDADTALALVRSDASIAALFVCIMLAEAKKLVIGAKDHRPDLRVVYTTHYPEMLLLDREAATVRSCACPSTSNRPELPWPGSSTGLSLRRHKAHSHAFGRLLKIGSGGAV